MRIESCEFRKNARSLLFLILALVIFSSCVGTVKDENAKSSNVVSAGKVAIPISFEGLQFVKPVSNNKIELFFTAAETEASEVIYEIFVNNSPIPLKVSDKSLLKNAQGLYLFTVTNLNIDTTYSFNMRATPAGEVSSTTIDPLKTKFATTFKNETANFLGVTSGQVSAGEAGRTSVVLKWTPAEIKGTNLNPRDVDPVQYEVTYISSLGKAINLNNTSYTGADRKTLISPTTLAVPPSISKINTITVSQLAPGMTYYFQVRAIHKGYISYGSDTNYQREQNTRYVTVTTLSSSGTFDFQPTLVNLTSPAGETGLTSLDVSWMPATGEFYNYKVCYKKVATPLIAPPVVDKFTDDDLVTVIANPGICVNRDADQVSYRLIGLEPYAYYQVKVIACKNVGCGILDRIKSNYMQRRVVTNVAQFNGIAQILDPQSDTSLDEIIINFDSPLVNSGYLNQFKLYCYSGNTDKNPFSIPLDGTTTSATGKATCDGITSLTTLPVNLNGYLNFSQITLRLSQVIDGTKNYCFALVPSITSSYLLQENMEGAVIKCITPQIKTPNIIQFPGKNNLCQTNTGKDLTVTWPIPSGGLYSQYVTFYKIKTAGNDFFSFADAVAAYLANNVSSPYKWVDGIDKALTSTVVSSLIPGKTYSIGVLPYLESSGQKIFAQYNVNVDDCALPLPVAKFEEWVDIFAIGPKEDGLTPKNAQGEMRMILETLDDDGIPVEASVNRLDDKTLDTTEPMMAARASSVIFDGVYGSRDNSEANPIHQYSNSGIVKIAWKDISLFNNSESLNTYQSDLALEPTPASKTTRKFGYKVYRSDDNQLTWIDLTSRSDKNKFQTIPNSGLLHPVSLQFRNRNNKSPEPAQNIITFTDYSVKFSNRVNEVDRARTYHYKVIPVFDGKELIYANGTNVSHHILKVTLPPRNMALVHRMMANRTLCLEMDKTILKGPSDFYSCHYNGVGSVGKSNPWVVGQTVLDQKGDLLVDRFELSCPITRGDNNKDNSDSTFSGTLLTFMGMSDYSNRFKGCFNPTSTTYEPSRGSYNPTDNYSYKQMIPGDCIGTDKPTLLYNGTNCINPLTASGIGLIYPGSSGRDELSQCADTDYHVNTYGDATDSTAFVNTSYSQTQSEFAAVYYYRSHDDFLRTNVTTPIKKFKAASGSTLNVNTVDSDSRVYSNCSVNLAYTNSTGQYKPRWISVENLFGGISVNGTNITLWNKTVDQVRSNALLYDGLNVKAPDESMLNTRRYDSAVTPLAKVFSSNSSKLPPLRGLGYAELQNVCSTFKVQVGFEPKGKSFIYTESEKNKHLLRRRESLISAAWPATYDETKVNELEVGTFQEDSQFKGCVGSTRLKSAGVNINGNPYVPHGNYYYPNMVTTRTANTFIFSGSSIRDGAGTNHSLSSEKCVSRFGVQDIPGNLYDANSDELFCDFTQDKLYLGTSNSVLNSFEITGNSTGYYNPNNLLSWVLSSPNSGSCSLVEAGAARNGVYTSGSTMNEIYNYSGVNTQLIQRSKSFDQNSVLTARNGDGSFLDFGQENLSSKLSIDNSISLTSSNGNFYFNHVLGIPLSCETGCADGSGKDNTLISADKLSSTNGYTTMNNPKNIAILDFPVNNATLMNYGVSEISLGSTYDTTDPNVQAIYYINSINLGLLPGDPNDNYFNPSELLVPGSSNPSSLQSDSFKISRSGTIKFYSGGYFLNEASRYSLNLSDYPPDNAIAGRCSVLINEN